MKEYHGLLGYIIILVALFVAFVLASRSSLSFADTTHICSLSLNELMFIKWKISIVLAVFYVLCDHIWLMGTHCVVMTSH